MTMSLRKAAFLSLVLSIAALQEVERQETTSSYSDDPLFHTQSNYVARKWQRSILVGNYMYIDGGEIYYKDENETIVRLPTASTYSIDMSSSWTNDTVSMTQIEKAVDGIHLSAPNLFHSLDDSSFYSYNGDKMASYDPNPVPANKLYKFTADGSGSGQWSEDNSFYTADSNFTQLSRVGGAASACSPDTCYAMGGWRNSNTNVGLQGSLPAAGLVSYNMTSQVWSNETLPSTTFTGAWSGGQLLFTDIAGSQGMLIAMGGSVGGQTTVDLSFDYVYLYDIATKNWYKQQTTGSIPATRIALCTVGIRGDNKVNSTYEIFMYGGEIAHDPSLSFDDVWVLSLPSFEWHQAGHTPVRGRGDHSCTVAGQRQMVIVGGLTPNASDPPDVPDIWPLGLGVFDLSEMVFQDRFDADASAYTSPEVVQSWYAKNGYVAKGVRNEVAQLFTQSKVSEPNNSTSSEPPANASPTIGSPSNGSPNDSSSTKSGKLNTGAIAGGIVGGIVVVAALLAGVWFVLRRRRRQESQDNQEVKGTSSMYEIDTQQRYEIGAPQKALIKTYESDSSQRHELQ